MKDVLFVSLNFEESNAQHLIAGNGKIYSASYVIGTYTQVVSQATCAEHIEEMKELLNTCGIPVKDSLSVPLKKIDVATYIGKGKVEEIRSYVAENNIDVVVFDDELSPSQQRNLEKLLKVVVMDRTEVILDIFAQRAETREATLQIELAKINYVLPRLKRLWGHFSRQKAGGGFLKGEGEKQLELDKRILQIRREKVNKDLKHVAKVRQEQRKARDKSGLTTFAIIGYTNVGKSTLLNALTTSNVLAENKLFATLDPTTKKYVLPNNQTILLTDTVGFIRKLPHQLVNSFRSTLEAAIHDDILLHIVDGSHPLLEEQIKVTNQLLKDLKSENSNIITIINKVDLCEDKVALEKLRDLYPRVVFISAKEQQGFEDLAEMMMEVINLQTRYVTLKIPQDRYELVAFLKRETKIEEDFQGNDVVVTVDLPQNLFKKFEEFILE